MSESLQYALSYLRRGFSIAPLKDGTKQPEATWKQYQTRRMSEDEARKIWEGHPERGIFVICGAISGGLTVADEDGPEAAAYIQKQGGLEGCPRVRTGSGKRHYYLRSMNGETIRGRNFRHSVLAIPLEVRAEGLGVVAPPSLHPETGRPYKWCSRSVSHPDREGIYPGIGSRFPV